MRSGLFRIIVQAARARYRAVKRTSASGEIGGLSTEQNKSGPGLLSQPQARDPNSDRRSALTLLFARTANVAAAKRLWTEVRLRTDGCG